MRITSILALLLLLIGCRDPIDLNFPTSQAKIVVDGFITNVEREHSIVLTRSSGFTADGAHVIDRIETAIVEIVDDSGNIVTLTHRADGEYRTPPFRAESGKNYKVIARLEDEIYESSFQTLPQYTGTTKIRYEAGVRQILSSNEATIIDQHGVNIMLDLDPVSEQVYYHFLQRNFFIWEAANADGVQFTNEFCYVRGHDRLQVDLFESGTNGLEETVTLDLDFIPVSPLMQHDFSVEVIQLITNQESHTYWNSIKTQFENVGSQFDAAPNSIFGNIKNSRGESTLGYFGVYNESSSRLFFNNNDSGIPFNQLEEFESCDTPYVPEDPCYDCLFALGIWSQLDAPDWWRDHEIEDDDGSGINTNFFNVWDRRRVELSDCSDSSMNSVTNSSCTGVDCEKLTFFRDETYTKVTTTAGQTTTVSGTFRTSGTTLELLPTGGSIEAFKFRITDVALNLESEVSGGCTQIVTYVR